MCCHISSVNWQWCSHGLRWALTAQCHKNDLINTSLLVTSAADETFASQTHQFTSQPYLSSISSQYLLLICCHSFSPANHLLLENHRSLIYICITSSLESTARFISSASPVLSRFTSSSILPSLSSFPLSSSFTLSLQAQNLHTRTVLCRIVWNLYHTSTRRDGKLFCQCTLTSNFVTTTVSKKHLISSCKNENNAVQLHIKIIQNIWNQLITITQIKQSTKTEFTYLRFWYKTGDKFYWSVERISSLLKSTSPSIHSSSGIQADDRRTGDSASETSSTFDTIVTAQTTTDTALSCHQWWLLV